MEPAGVEGQVPGICAENCLKGGAVPELLLNNGLKGLQKDLLCVGGIFTDTDVLLLFLIVCF